MKTGVPLALVCLLALALSGCKPNFFKEKGTVTSQGNWLHNWSFPPQGCIRAPSDAQPPGQTDSILTLLWEDAGLHNWQPENNDRTPDVPLQLRFSRAPAGSRTAVVAALQTKQDAGMKLDASNCSRLSLESQEHSPTGIQVRTTLSGHAVLDCQVKTGRVTADVQFEECEY